jgi:hypothetical protein
MRIGDLSSIENATFSSLVLEVRDLALVVSSTLHPIKLAAQVQIA